MKIEVVFGLENAAWPALLVDAGGAVLRANPAAMSVFGAAVVGDAPSLAAIWAAENGVTAAEFLERFEQSPTPVTNLKFRASGGPLLHYAVSICPFNREGHKWFLLQLSLAPAAATAAPPANAPAVVDGNLAVKQRLDCALQLARTVSLDFNNALTSILGHTSFLLSKAEAGHPWRLSLLEVEKSAGKAAEIAGELAVFSQQEKQTRRAPPGNLNAVVSRCVEFFRNAGGGKIEWKSRLERELFVVRFDEAKVQQALTKVMENAAEAVNGDGQIIVQSRNVELAEPVQDQSVRLVAGAYVCVEVTDNGQGIGPEILPRVFEPFFTTKKPPHRGLGLALVYGIVSNHGGGVAVAGQSGAGASVRVYLPAEKRVARKGAGTDESLHGAETILVVDDENLLLTMAETILTEFGYKVFTANSGQKALAILSRDDAKVNLVITDLVMPGMGGRELAERIRQLAPAMRILCMSGGVPPADQQSGFTYLQKPYTSRDLLAKVRQMLAPEASVD